MSELRTVNEWADFIMDAVSYAQADGCTVEIVNNCMEADCCGNELTLDVYRNGSLVEIRY